MKHLFLVCALVFVYKAWSTPHSDSLVTFTGGHAKYVWVRTVVCDDNYNPVAPVTQLVLLDTREGKERVLTTGSSFRFIRISRSGKWVTWNTSSRTYICDLTSQAPQAKVLLDKSDCTFWCARAMWIDPATHTEYVYCLDNYGPVPFNNTLVHGNGIYKVPLTQNGTADVSKAEKLKINQQGSLYVDDAISVSADGKKLGGAFPWPDTYILDIPTGNLDYRHETGFGCQANLAPDNSYRFFHCEGDHFGVFMFAANMVDNHWYINMSKNLDGFGNKDGMDFVAPRWSNHVQFVSSTFPMDDNWDAYDQGAYAGKDAAWVQANAVDLLLHVPQFVLQKFSSDFKTIEQSKLIASDIRYLQWGGDAWLENGVANGSTELVKKTKHEVNSDIHMIGSTLDIRNASVSTSFKIVSTNGKKVYSRTIHGPATLNLAFLKAGTYVVTVKQQSKVSSLRIRIER